MFTSLRSFFTLIVVGAVAGCSTARESGSASGIRLDSKLLSPVDVQLKWKNVPQITSGCTVDWGTQSNGEYVVVVFVSPRVHSFVHEDVVPETTCYYRVRPYFGPASKPVEITTGKAPANGEVDVPDVTWPEPKTLPSGVAAAQSSIRNPAGATAATPTDLKARLVHPTGIQFTWTDHATDEEGYMLEMKTPDVPDFQVCAIVDPNINSYGFALVPPETKIQFRIRAFYFGQPSNIVSQKTGLRPANRKEPQS